jgi:hypothetical protein
MTTQRTFTQSERLTRIEVLLEAAVTQRHEDREAMKATIDKMAENIELIKNELAEDKADLAQLKNRGAGVLIGVGLAGGAIGAGIAEFLGSFLK